jgi:hypothetical protein
MGDANTNAHRRVPTVRRASSAARPCARLTLARRVLHRWGDTTWNDRGCGGDGDFYANKVCPCEVPMTVASLDDDGIERYN